MSSALVQSAAAQSSKCNTLVGVFSATVPPELGMKSQPPSEMLQLSKLSNTGLNSGVFKGGRWCDHPPPFGPTVNFLANFALFCRLHFATEPYKIRVQRHGRLYYSMLLQTSMPDQRLLVTCPCLQLRRGGYCWRTSTDGL